MEKVRCCRIRGSLSEYADGFRDELVRLGYTGWSTEYKVNQASRLSRWLAEHDVQIGELTEAQWASFLASMATTRRRPPTKDAFRPLLEYLHAQGLQFADDHPLVLDPVEGLVDDYTRWMITERRLAARTVDRYAKSARVFLTGRVSAADAGYAIDVNANAVTGFLLAEAARGLKAGSMHGRVAEQRSLLRFLYVKGLIPTQLAQIVPPVPGWKAVAVPPRMSPQQVGMLLGSCDRDTAAGLRDAAMLILMARLGLRAAEVAALTLDDLHWRAGELTVTGKARRTDPMPMPVDVGTALSNYLRHARPPSQSRIVFLTVPAPHHSLRPTAVSQTVWRQSRRAGLTPMRAHCLRHALATNLLEHGLTLPEIGQVLRQQDLATTAGYAKVDYTALRELARPWPGTPQ
jgi:site-specific recombinase XerD